VRLDDRDAQHVPPVIEMRRRAGCDPADDRERAAPEAEVKAQESRVRNVTATIARSGFSDALAEQLGLEEETLRSLRLRLAAKVPLGERPAAVPDPDAAARFLALNTNPAVLSDGRVSVHGSCGGLQSAFASPFRPRCSLGS
jgi:hypothetical protein